MRDPAAARAFVSGEIEALEPFDFVLVGPAANVLHRVEISRTEDGALEVSVPGRPPVVPELSPAERSGLRDRGFASEEPSDPTRPWSCKAGDAKLAVDVAVRVLFEVFGEAEDAALDVVHGNRRAYHEARTRLAATRDQVEGVLKDLMGHPPQRDEDDDFMLPIGDVRVMVAPRALPNGPSLVRVFAVTNVGVNVVPELGLLLARLNFGLMYGRFALDAEHNSIWFDETLLGDPLNEEALRFAVRVVAATADEWDDRLKAMFGGATYQEALQEKGEGTPPPVKPGEPQPRGHSGYL